MAEEEKKKMTPIVALRNFFGQKPGQTMSEFIQEMKRLSEEEKILLARLACEEMGVELDLAKRV